MNTEQQRAVLASLSAIGAQHMLILFKDEAVMVSVASSRHEAYRALYGGVLRLLGRIEMGDWRGWDTPLPQIAEALAKIEGAVHMAVVCQDGTCHIHTTHKNGERTACAALYDDLKKHYSDRRDKEEEYQRKSR